jgi:hypothetical protein
MKKQILILAFICIAHVSFSQEWKKNSSHTSLYALDQFGGTNITGIGIGIVNPTARLEVFGRTKLHSTLIVDSTLNIGSNYIINGLNGSFKNASWASSANRLMQADVNGNLIPLASGSASQVLYGNGTWGALPVAPVIWQQAGSAVYYNNGFVGIGTNNPQVALDVVGDVKVSNNLYVGGGILISQKVEASSSMKTDTVHSASGETKFTSKLMLLDKIQVEGATLLKSQFQVNGTSLFNGTVQANILNVSGNTTFGNNATVNGTLTANDLNINGNLAVNTLKLGVGTNSLNITAQSIGNGATVLSLGRTVPVIIMPTTCIAPLTGVTTQTDRMGVVNSLNSNMLDMRNDGSNGFIDFGYDVSVHPLIIDTLGNTPPSTPIPALKLNSACWGDVEIAKGGGFVSMGSYCEVGSPVRNGSITSNIKGYNIGQRISISSPFTDAFINSNPAYTKYNSQLFVNKNHIHALSVFNTSTNVNGDELFSISGDGKTQIKAKVKANKYFTVTDISNTSSPIESFVVYGDGKTEITTTSTDAFTIKNNFTNDINFKVKTNGLVYAREINVATGAFPDYVFAKSYNLKPLLEVEKFIQNNNHLEGFEKAKYYEANDITVFYRKCI